jgi:serine protease Do
MNFLKPRLVAALTVAAFSSLTVVSSAASPNIVIIEARDKPATEGEPLNSSLGFIVEKDGFLITNYTNLTNPKNGVLLDYFQVGMTDGSGKNYTARIIGVEPTINLGILKIDSTDVFETSAIARNRTITVGTMVAAVAKSDGTQNTVVEGPVTGLNTRQCYQENLASTMFRVRLPLSIESLGGPVYFPDSGEVTALYTGFKPTHQNGREEAAGEIHLLPIDLCFNIYDSIKQKGSFKSPWTGFSVRPLSDSEMNYFPTAKKHNGGIVIEHIWDNSPAQKLGIQVNDILVQFSYNRILTVGDFQKWLYMYGVGHSVKLMILRNGKDYLVTDYVIEERPIWAKPK